LLNAVSRLLLKQHCCGEIRCLLLNLIIVLVIRLIECWDLLDLLGQDLCNNVECSEVRLFRWWTCSGSNRLFLCWLWSIRWFVSEGDHCWVWHSDLSHWSHCQKVGVWVGPRVSEDLCLNAVGHCEFSSILLALCVAKVTLIGNVAA
jgi:hypothetical protein